MKGKYYECINNEGGIDSFTIGKVYECITDDLEEFGAFIDDTGEPNGWCGQNHARFLLDEGARYTKEDMMDFAEWFSDNWDLDFKADSALETWLKERKYNGSL